MEQNKWGEILPLAETKTKKLNNIFLFFCVLKNAHEHLQKGDASLLSSPAVNFSFASGVKKKKKKRRRKMKSERRGRRERNLPTASSMD